MTEYEYAIIIAGGRIDDDFAFRFVLEHRTIGETLLIAADRGLLFLERHGIVPDLIVGDFDSVREGYEEEYLRAHPTVEVHEFNWEKDMTDTEIAAMEAAGRGCTSIDILGATGTRFDHMLGSVQVLSLLYDKGVAGRILDPCNRISMHEKRIEIGKKEQWGKYVSLFAWGGDVEDVTMEGFHFTMRGGGITSSGTLTVSNQIEDDRASVTFPRGRLLMVESKDAP